MAETKTQIDFRNLKRSELYSSELPGSIDELQRRDESWIPDLSTRQQQVAAAVGALIGVGGTLAVQYYAKSDVDGLEEKVVDNVVDMAQRG